MTDVAIRVENLGKRYRLGSHEPYHRFSELMMRIPRSAARFAYHGLRNRFRRAGSDAASSTSARGDFWALRDISFDVKEGEVVGIIGRNGAGKSTLLKILSRITEPTTGQFGVRGRIGSLLEVGTGFHPELTGRENIYLSGMLLGMTRADIRRQFDAIVEFSELEKFLDTPVKRYSSGMYVRLGFGIAAHLQPEILIVDEVLAVGDAAFQKKCLGKMGDVAKTGRTVLVVSHNMAVIRSLCSSCILLSAGRVKAMGDSGDVVSAYNADTLTLDHPEQIETFLKRLPHDDAIRLHHIQLKQADVLGTEIGNHAPLEVTVEYEVLRRVTGLRVYADITDELGNLLVRTFQDDDEDVPLTVSPGRYSTTLVIPEHFLAPRDYTLSIRATIHNVRPCFQGESIPARLRVTRSGRVNRAYPAEPIRSLLQPLLRWSTRPSELTGDA